MTARTQRLIRVFARYEPTTDPIAKANLCRADLARARDLAIYRDAAATQGFARFNCDSKAATSAHYPDYLAKEAERLTKIKARGSIRGEAEFYFVRHRIDLLEGDLRHQEELHLLYEMADRFEAKRR